ncbi:hypothetical protein [Nitrospirillum sp. BR 11163]|uniref:hypothetical protein n=1 Tax=Nitrospirillum sp. BR 11163 TaxID=3104323 RepID=UPI002AFE5E71|nr:hypothetical protein [Nitrospirillum sp. BR 11163]MEA1676093.1 hypothetical protein [Nitrospirillum sp. BR 11163]
MGAGVVRRWMVALVLGGLAVAPQVAQAGAGLGLEMVCADAVNAAPTAACVAGYRALWSARPAEPVAASPASAVARQTAWGPPAVGGLDHERRELGLYTRYAGALLAGVPTELAMRGGEVRTAAVTRLVIIGQSLAASAYRPVAALRRADRDPSQTATARIARLLRPEADMQSP